MFGSCDNISGIAGWGYEFVNMANSNKEQYITMVCSVVHTAPVCTIQSWISDIRKHIREGIFILNNGFFYSKTYGAPLVK